MRPAVRRVSKRLIEAAKTDNKRVHITPRISGWAVRKEGNAKPFKITRTRQEAIELAREYVKNGRASIVVIHTKKGQFRTTK